MENMSPKKQKLRAASNFRILPPFLFAPTWGGEENTVFKESLSRQKNIAHLFQLKHSSTLYSKFQGGEQIILKNAISLKQLS